MRKRYAITMDRDAHTAMVLEAVRAGKSVGDWISDTLYEVGKLGTIIVIDEVYGGQTLEEMHMDDIKKAIEPDKVKIQERPGKPPELSKGLGDIPGVTRSDPSFGSSRPAPKPGKAK